MFRPTIIRADKGVVASGVKVDRAAHDRHRGDRRNVGAEVKHEGVEAGAEADRRRHPQDDPVTHVPQIVRRRVNHLSVRHVAAGKMKYARCFPLPFPVRLTYIALSRLLNTRKKNKNNHNMF